jgi:hypothetical protein
VLTESDYRSGGGPLSWSRHLDTHFVKTLYDPTSPKAASDGIALGRGWRHSYDKRVYEVPGNLRVMAKVRLSDGKIKVFNPQGGAFAGVGGRYGNSVSSG